MRGFFSKADRADKHDEQSCPQILKQLLPPISNSIVTSPKAPPVPLYIFREIVKHGENGVKAVCLRLSREAYAYLHPQLYRCLHLNTEKALFKFCRTVAESVNNSRMISTLRCVRLFRLGIQYPMWWRNIGTERLSALLQATPGVDNLGNHLLPNLTRADFWLGNWRSSLDTDDRPYFGTAPQVTLRQSSSIAPVNNAKTTFLSQVQEIYCCVDMGLANMYTTPFAALGMNQVKLIHTRFTPTYRVCVDLMCLFRNDRALRTVVVDLENHLANISKSYQGAEDKPAEYVKDVAALICNFNIVAASNATLQKLYIRIGSEQVWLIGAVRAFLLRSSPDVASLMEEKVIWTSKGGRAVYP